MIPNPPAPETDEVDAERWPEEAKIHVPHRAAQFLAMAAGAAVLALGRDFLVPVALAGLLAFVLEPLARRLQRTGLPAGLSSVLSVLLLGGVLGVLVFTVVGQTLDFSKHLPDYRENLSRKIATLRENSIGGPLAEAKADLETMGRDLPKAAPSNPGAGLAGAAPEPKAAPAPLRVELVQPRSGLLGSIFDSVGPVLAPLGSLALVLVLTAFLLSYRGDLRDRLVRLTNLGEIALTTKALDEAAQRVSRYLLSMLAVNALYGAVLAGAFALIGLPNALLWGLLAGALRFMPYLGTWVGAALPTLVALSVFDGWAKAGLTLGSVLVTDILLGNILEPLIYGERTGLAPWAVVLSTLFWTWMWGIPGLLLAVPLTLVLVVVAHYVPGLRWLEVLLGNSAPLAPDERVYQRLLALDPDGAHAVVEEVVKARGLVPAFDEVLLPALARAGMDRARGRIDAGALTAVRTGVASILADLAVETPHAAPTSARPSVLCVPAGDASDGLAAEMLCEALRSLGVLAVRASHKVLSSELGASVAGEIRAVVCVIGIPPLGTARTRHACRRIRESDPDVPVVAVAIDAAGDSDYITGRMTKAGATRAATGIADAAAQARDLCSKDAPVAAASPV